MTNQPDITKRLRDREDCECEEAANEIERLREDLKTLARVEGHLRELVTEIGGKIDAWRKAMLREAWQEGLTLAEATEQMLHAADNCKSPVTVKGAGDQLKFAARKAVEAMNERDAARADRNVLNGLLFLCRPILDRLRHDRVRESEAVDKCLCDVCRVARKIDAVMGVASE